MSKDILLQEIERVLGLLPEKPPLGKAIILSFIAGGRIAANSNDSFRITECIKALEIIT